MQNVHAPPKRDRSVYYIFGAVGIGCFVVFVLPMCVMGGCMVVGGGVGALGMSAVSVPADHTKAFFTDVRSRDYQRALSRMSPTYQASHPLPTFQQSVESIPALVSHTDDTLSSRNLTGHTATMSGVLSTAQGSAPFTVTLTENGTVWQIDTVVVDGAALP